MEFEKNKKTFLITELTDDIRETFKKISIISLDIEGVDLGRNGTISIIQIATNQKCFIFDVLSKKNFNKNKDKYDPLLQWIKDILESKTILKIIHDCRMDSDALFHKFGIILTNVHDTSCWHQIITGSMENINTILEFNDIKKNVFRNSNIYQKNHAFWEIRPLTPYMINWASEDVFYLVDIYNKQIKTIASNEKINKAKILSKEYVSNFRNMKVDFINVRNIGRFIGRGGSNIKALSNRTNTIIYKYGNRSTNTFSVYFNNLKNFEEVKRFT